MGLLLAGRQLEQQFSSRPLFHGVDFELNEGDRIGIIGPNGAGKSSLLKILAGMERPAGGTLVPQKGVRLCYVSQIDDLPLDQSVEQVVTAAAADPAVPDHQIASRIDRTLKRFGFPDWQQQIGAMSGGWRKRVSLAQQLVREPNLLLLDEPTNHLDLEGIEWLEEFLAQANFAWAMVSHDRYLLERAASRIIEINAAYPNGCFAAPGNYSKFMERREDFLAGQQRQQQALAGKVRREIEWLRRGPPARTTKAQYRIDEAARMIGSLDELKRRNTSGGSAGLEFAGTERQSNKLIAVKGIGKTRGGRKLFADIEFVLGPGTRLGLLGANGSGKSTLLKIVSGELEPDEGTVWRADVLRISTFDQDRKLLNPDDTLRDALSPTGDTIFFRDKPFHVEAWAKRFLFRSEQLQVRVRSLSGGEQARILLARLMARPADVLLLDEPTNDLDIDSLEVLEDALMEFPGVVILITHDRYLLERVSSFLIGIHADGTTTTCTDLLQWTRAREAVAAKQECAKQSAAKPAKSTRTATAETAGTDTARPAAKKKLSYAEKKELEAMEEKILEVESQISDIKAELERPEVTSNHQRLSDACTRLETAQSSADTLYARWQELEERSK